MSARGRGVGARDGRDARPKVWARASRDDLDLGFVGRAQGVQTLPLGDV